MKAIVLKDFGGPEMMELADVDTPSPKGDQILIKVMNASVNRPDVIQRQGNYPPPPGDSEILGLEVAGTIEAVGADATRPRASRWATAWSRWSAAAAMPSTRSPTKSMR
jgi:NADPH:quinone reductase-like Zn-dependent oxidoreductase